MRENENPGQQIAIVTGGATGLGLAIATKFVKNNIFTIIIGRNEKELKNAFKFLGNLSSFIIHDLTNLEGIPELINKIVNKYKRIDILVNNAGIHLKKPLTEVTDEEYQNIILTNQTSVFSISREVSKIMLKQKQGNIINISSMASQYGIPKVIAYTASKSAIEGMTRSMAVELSPHGIRVNCIAPGFIETCMSARALNNDPERKQKVLSRTPIGKLGTPEDVANTVLFLVSDSANYITGTIIPVDGGNVIGF